MSKTAKQEGDSTASSCGVKVSTAGDPVPSAAFRCSACDAVADYSASGAVFLRLLATGLCHAGVPAAVAASAKETARRSRAMAGVSAVPRARRAHRTRTHEI